MHIYSCVFHYFSLYTDLNDTYINITRYIRTNICIRIRLAFRHLNSNLYANMLSSSYKVFTLAPLLCSVKKILARKASTLDSYMHSVCVSVCVLLYIFVQCMYIFTNSRARMYCICI